MNKHTTTMDIQIERKKGVRGLFTRRMLPYWGGGIFLLFVAWLLLRDHDAKKLEARKQRLRDIAEFLNKVYGEGRVTVEIEDTYRNIGEAIKPCFEIVEAIDAAMKAEGVAPFYTPMRGGTDGTILSFEGIPCPNICTGGHNFHGRYEYVPVQSMEKIANILIGIVKSFAK